VDQLTHLRERLRQQAYLFDEPEAYAAGVDDALDALDDLLSGPDAVAIDLTDDQEPVGVPSP